MQIFVVYGAGAVHIAEAAFGRKIIQHGSSPAGLRTIGVLADPKIELVWRGHRVSGDDLLVFPYSGELFSVSEADFHVFTCSFPESLLSEVAQQWRAESLDELCGGNEVISDLGDSLTPIRNYLRSLS